MQDRAAELARVKRKYNMWSVRRYESPGDVFYLAEHNLTGKRTWDRTLPGLEHKMNLEDHPGGHPDPVSIDELIALTGGNPWDETPPPPPPLPQRKRRDDSNVLYIDAHGTRANLPRNGPWWPNRA